MNERAALREQIAKHLDLLLSNYGSTLVGRAYDVIDPSSRAEAVEFYANLFDRALFDPANLEQRTR